MPYRNRNVLLVAITLFVFAGAPILMVGYSDIKQGEAAMKNEQFGSAVQHYLHAIKIFPWRKELWEKAGLAAIADRDYENAVLYLTRAAELSEQGWAALGLSQFNSGNFSAALDAYEHGLQEYDSPLLYMGVASIYRQEKNWQAESDALTNQIRLDSNDAYAHYRLGLLLAVLDPDRSLPELMLASSLDPEADAAVQTLRAALNLSDIQANRSEQMLTIGRALGLVQEWDLAITAFESALVSDPENAEAWAWLGEAKQQTGQDGGAELDQAVSFEDASVVVHALRGQYWNRKSEYSKMLLEYQQAATLEPDNPVWQAGIGSAYSKDGDLAAAFISYQQATELAPDDPTYWRLLAVFCAENGIYVEETGLPAAQKAVELAPNDPLALDALGWSYLSSGRYTNAGKVLLDMIERFPDHYPSHIHLAMTYLAQGNQTAAFSELSFVRDADAGGPDGSFAEILLARYFPQGN